MDARAPVIVVGAGPVGLVLTLALARHGVRTILLEQGDTERLVLDAVRASGRCDVRFGAEAIGLVNERDRVRVTVREGQTEYELEAAYVVGCDGASSFVREALGLEFEGTTYALHATLADVDLDDHRDALPWPRFFIGDGGVHFVVRLYAGAVVIGTVSRYTDVLTRIFLQSPPVVIRAAFWLLREFLVLPPLRRRMLRRTGMLDLRCPPSALLARQRAAGRRLPDPLLRDPDGHPVRLHQLLSHRPTLVEVCERRAPLEGMPLPVVRIGPGGYVDRTRMLSRILGGRDGWILVRPDGHVAWARRRAQGIAEAIAHALGLARGVHSDLREERVLHAPETRWNVRWPTRADFERSSHLEGGMSDEADKDQSLDLSWLLRRRRDD